MMLLVVYVTCFRAFRSLRTALEALLGAGEGHWPTHSLQPLWPHAPASHLPGLTRKRVISVGLQRDVAQSALRICDKLVDYKHPSYRAPLDLGGL